MNEHCICPKKMNEMAAFLAAEAAARCVQLCPQYFPQFCPEHKPNWTISFPDFAALVPISIH
jgi:hypothetical protein